MKLIMKFSLLLFLFIFIACESNNEIILDNNANDSSEILSQNDKENEFCALKIIKNMMQEQEEGSECKKSCFNLEYLGQSKCLGRRGS